MNSMTGFGQAERKIPFGWIKIEVKSLNHKFKELIFNLPSGFSSLEESLRRRLEKIKRGRINFSLQISPSVKKQIFIDKELVRSYLENIRKIEKDFRLRESLSLDTILNLPGVVNIIEDKKEKEKIFTSINLLAKKAIENLISSRKREGACIYGELKKRIKTIEGLSKIIKEREKVFLKEKKEFFSKPEDWEMFLKNTDITEELMRVDFHLKNFKRISKIKSRAIGKELDFISQEMMREANTMTAKSTDKEIIFNLICIKSEIEKIREQLQNVE